MMNSSPVLLEPAIILWKSRRNLYKNIEYFSKIYVIIYGMMRVTLCVRKKYEVQIMNYLETVTRNVNIAEGYTAIESILTDVYFHEGISNKELSRKALLPIPIITAIKKEFIKVELFRQDQGIRLTPKGRQYVEDELGYKGLDVKVYNRILNDPEGAIEAMMNEFPLKPLYEERPRVDVTIDQSKCTVETSLKRAILCLQNHSLIGKNILCVGDDDLVSIALGFLLKKLFPGRPLQNTITVIEIDQRFIDYITTVCQRENLPISCVRADLKHNFPKELVGKFDCFFTDPPYTLSGAVLFLSRGITALKKQTGLSVFLSFAHKPPVFQLELQKEFNQMGLAIHEMIPKFNQYEGAEMIGNTGQMMVLRTTHLTTPISDENIPDLIYTGEIKKTIRSYECKNCGKIIRVGSTENIRTIEELKEQGCLICGKNIFNRISRETATASNKGKPAENDLTSN